MSLIEGFMGVEMTTMGKVFVWLPKRLHNGGWIWGDAYMRNVISYRKEIPGIGTYESGQLCLIEYYTAEEAAMMKLKGEC